MKTITIEEHILSPLTSDYFTTGGGRALSSMGPLKDALTETGSSRISKMDQSGITMQVLSQSPYDYATVTPQQVSQANDDLQNLILTNPSRYAGFAALPLGTPEHAPAELERCIKDLEFKATMVNGMIGPNKFLDHPDFFPTLEKAVELDCPVYIHPGFPPKDVREAYYEGFGGMVDFALGTFVWGWHSETAIHVLRLVCAGVFEKLPGLKIVIGHMGEMLPFMLDRIDERLTPLAPNLKKPAREYLLNNVWITTSGIFSNAPFECALKTWGIDKIMFSVDYPYSSCSQGRKFLDECGLQGEDLEKLCYKNVEALLKL